MSTPKTIIDANPELKETLRVLATKDFDSFLELLGKSLDDVQLYVCAERLRDKSYQQIANSLKRYNITVTRYAVRDRCKKCD